MKRIIIIDGENLTYALRKYDKKTGGDGNREFLSIFDFRGMLTELLEDVTFDEIIWYGAKIKVSKQNRQELKEKTDEYLKNQGRMVNHLNKQKIVFEKVGYLRDRTIEGDSSQILKLTEKGVDVGIAVKIMELAAEKTDYEIVLVSSDTDLLPAIDSAKKRGVSFAHIGYDYMPIYSIQKRSEYIRLITPPLFKKYKQ